MPTLRNIFKTVASILSSKKENAVSIKADQPVFVPKPKREKAVSHQFTRNTKPPYFESQQAAKDRKARKTRNRMQKKSRQTNFATV